MNYGQLLQGKQAIESFKKGVTLMLEEKKKIEEGKVETTFKCQFSFNLFFWQDNWRSCIHSSTNFVSTLFNGWNLSNRLLVKILKAFFKYLTSWIQALRKKQKQNPVIYWNKLHKLILPIQKFIRLLQVFEFHNKMWKKPKDSWIKATVCGKMLVLLFQIYSNSQCCLFFFIRITRSSFLWKSSFMC